MNKKIGVFISSLRKEAKMTRQQVAFLKECRKSKGFGSLREDFYTKFKPEKCGFGAVTWLMN